MKDQDCLNATSVKTGNKLMNTKKQCIENYAIDFTALIRSIQRVEGNFDCFRKARGYCNQSECYWRPYCLENNSVFNKKKN
jgi:hypothetical protein